MELLADAFLRARERDPRLHLLLAGGGPDEALLRERLEEGGRSDSGADAKHPPATFLGWLDREQLARAYASSDVFLFCSSTDTYGQVITEAQASGLPVVAVARGRPRIADPPRRRRAGCVRQTPSRLRGPSASWLHLNSCASESSRQARAVGSGRTWEKAFEQLAAGYNGPWRRERRFVESPS